MSISRLQIAACVRGRKAPFVLIFTHKKAMLLLRWVQDSTLKELTLQNHKAIDVARNNSQSSFGVAFLTLQPSPRITMIKNNEKSCKAHNTLKRHSTIMCRAAVPSMYKAKHSKNKGRAACWHATFACRVQAQGSVMQGAGGVNWRRAQMPEVATGAGLSLLLAQGSTRRAAAWCARS